MALVPALLVASAQLAGAEASIGGPTSPGHWLVQRAVFTNTDSVSHAITVYRVPSAGTAGVTNKVISAFVLNPSGQPGHTYTAPELAGMILNGGDTIHAFADTGAKVNVTISGFTY